MAFLNQVNNRVLISIGTLYLFWCVYWGGGGGGGGGGGTTKCV